MDEPQIDSFQSYLDASEALDQDPDAPNPLIRPVDDPSAALIAAALALEETFLLDRVFEQASVAMKFIRACDDYRRANRG